jgi:arylsulfatase A-like enzyme
LSFLRLNRDKPFFLYLPLTIPHANNEAGDQGMEVPDYGPYADEDWPDAQKGLAAMITRMDAGIGKILDLLAELSIDENTLIFFTSDNGPHREGGNDPAFFDSNGPLRGIKRDLYEGGIRVPLIARWKGVIPADTSTGHISGFQDFFPTMAQIIGTQDLMPAMLDGISFLPTLVSLPELQSRHSHLYWEFHEQGGKTAVLQNNWKAIYFAKSRQIELYDLDADPGETTNVSSLNLMKTIELRNLMDSSRIPSEIWGPSPTPQNRDQPRIMHDMVTPGRIPARSWKLADRF